MAEWTQETTETVLTMVKTDLKIKNSTAYDVRLTQDIEAAIADIQREGVKTLSGSIEDMELVAIYAAWLYTQRIEGGAMPRMLRVKLNNRIFSGRMKNSSNEG